ncbi:transcriptional regulator [Rhizobium altiplani]|uniref:Transcriptional regulator n=1 Tax=Rhizobium altiplani TaxID=1864509 RepID=A0A109JFJ4_9HYPH|nr:response regulator [Rhizobium altiplani]KWV47935.1 transcriptional regulator [Rhizobium altiplani]
MAKKDLNNHAFPINLFAGKRILIVEEDYFVADEARRLLEAAGARITGATAPFAIGMIDPEITDAAILDIRLDGEAAFLIADRLYSFRIPFVFATSHVDAGVKDSFGGFHLCGDLHALGDIALALFSTKHH